MAASLIDEAALAERAACLERMRTAETHELLVHHDAQFHDIVARPPGMPRSPRCWRASQGRRSGRACGAATWTRRSWLARSPGRRTSCALAAHDPELAATTATVQVATTEAWIREVVESGGRIAPTNPDRR